jgi:hypothetical protein
MAGLTKLEAVNIILGNIGEAPVSSLVSPESDAFALSAITTLDETVRVVQTEDWEFNKDTDYPMTPDVSGNITITDSMISVDSSARSASLDVTVRQGMLYNKYDHTFVFDDIVYTDVKWQFTYEELPQYIRQYIVIRAARIFAQRQTSDGLNAQLTAEDETRTMIAAKRTDKRMTDKTIFTNSGMQRILYRRLQ